MRKLASIQTVNAIEPIPGADAEIGGRLSFKAINPKFLLKYDE